MTHIHPCHLYLASIQRQFQSNPVISQFASIHFIFSPTWPPLYLSTEMFTRNMWWKYSQENLPSFILHAFRFTFFAPWIEHFLYFILPSLPLLFQGQLYPFAHLFCQTSPDPGPYASLDECIRTFRNYTAICNLTIVSLVPPTTLSFDFRDVCIIV